MAVLAHADGPGRVVLEGEDDVLAEYAGAMTGVPASRGDTEIQIVRALVDRVVSRSRSFPSMSGSPLGRHDSAPHIPRSVFRTRL